MNGHDLLALGFKGKEVGLAHKVYKDYCGNWARKFVNGTSEDEAVFDNRAKEFLSDIYASPASYLGFMDADVLALAKYLIHQRKPKPVINLEKGRPFSIFSGKGTVEIADNAIEQMKVAMSVPPARKGALMPDAHLGYGLPIGGVWGLEQAVSPNAVGSDIACQVNATIFDVDFEDFNREFLTDVLFKNTQFNHHAWNKDFSNMPIFTGPWWQDIPFLKANPQLKEFAIKQFASSGDGNHFANFGVVSDFGLREGRLALVTHWGSRSFGARIANHFNELAVKSCEGLPKEAQGVAWLDSESDDGLDYINCMRLAEWYASAGHDYVHARIGVELGSPMVVKHVRSVHNIATYENELWMHRKGATPAGRYVEGVIPGSMVHPTYLVEGKGLAASLNSASHGAGRRFSRGEAKRTLSMDTMQHLLIQNDVTLLGAALDESPEAYKNIEDVMEAQKHQVRTTGAIYPKIVRMAT